METIKFSRSREKFLFLLSIFLSRARLLSMPALWYLLLTLPIEMKDIHDDIMIKYFFMHIEYLQDVI